jgi:hypothetical protein
MKLKKALAPTMAGKTSPPEPPSFWLSLCRPAAELASIVVGRVVIGPGSGLECPRFWAICPAECQFMAINRCVRSVVRVE